VGFAHAPVSTVEHKINPLFGSIAEMLNNKDFYGNKIYNEDDPLVKKFADLTAYAAKQFIPFSMRNAAQSGKEQGEQGVGKFLPTTPTKAASFFGITPAPKYIVKSPAVNKIDEYMGQQRPEGGRTAAQAARSDEMKRLAGGLRAGKLTPDDVRESEKEGKITPQQGREVLREQHASPLARISKLPLDQALNVWDVANEKERNFIWPLLSHKAQSLKNFDPDTRAQLRERLHTALEQHASGQVGPTRKTPSIVSLWGLPKTPPGVVRK
jgi:hypothetical protein